MAQILVTSHAHPIPNHPLMHHSDGRDYTCHACNTPGSGARFRCHACPADIHVYCSHCPQELSPSFLHSHPLALADLEPRLHHRTCDVCRESICGMLYRCEDCGFHVHPLCTQLPEEVRHVIDHTHKLRLKKLASGNCDVCGVDCSSLWVYGCDVCGVNIELKCLLKPYRRSGSRGIKHVPPPPPHFPGGVLGPHGYGYYNYDGNFMNPNGFGFGYGGGYSSHAHWGSFPNNYYNHFAYPPPLPLPPPPPPSPIYYGSVPPPPPTYYGSVPFAHNHGAHTRPSFWGSMFGSSMFSLVESLAAGAITEFIFGSA